MARPKKSAGVDARSRIIAAFWTLLESNKLHEVSIGMIAAQAGCNRGTFYYHFVDKDALIEAVLDDELRGVSRDIFALNSGSDCDALAKRYGEGGLKRVALFMRQGGRNVTEQHVREYQLALWRALLCPEGGELLPKTTYVLSYMMSGMLGLVAALGDMRSGGADAFPSDFLRATSRNALAIICEAQDVERSEVMFRLNMLSQFSKVEGSF